MPEPSPEALFRYLAVSQVISRMLAGERKRDSVQHVVALTHQTLDGGLRCVTLRTLYRWLSAFEVKGFPGLEPKRRTSRRHPPPLPGNLLDFIAREKRDDPRASIPELIRRARELGKIPAGLKVDRSTVYRWLLREAVPVFRKKTAKERDARRFAYPNRMMMVLADGKHFRAGVTRAKRVAIFFLDDATRMGLHVVVGSSENKLLFIRGLYETIRRYGFMSAVYLDRGPGFIALDTVSIFQALDIPLIHGAAGYPEGRGKIERFNETAGNDLLNGLDGRPDVDPAVGALEVRLQHYLFEVYGQRPHESLGNLTPAGRFFSDPAPLRFPDSDTELRQHFVVYEDRRVSPDRVVQVDGRDYEMPLGCSGRTVTLHRRVLAGTVHFLHEGRLIQLHPVDLAANAESQRARGSSPSQEPPRSLKKSAADLAFDHDFFPAVSDDGGFIPPCPETSP